MGAGKSTLAREIANQPSTVLISEDDWLSKLFPGQIHSLKDYQRYSQQIKPLISEPAQQLLGQGVSVVLDFPANTKAQRQWLLSISGPIDSEHQCYFVDRPDEVCIEQLLKRANPNTDTVEMFRAVSQHFTRPAASENLNLIPA